MTTDDEPYTEAVDHEDHRQALLAIIDYLHRNCHLRALLDVHAVVHRFPCGAQHTGPSLIGRDDLPRLHDSALRDASMRAAVDTFDAALRLLPSASHVGVSDVGVMRDDSVAMAHNASLLLADAAPASDSIVHDAALRTARALWPKGAAPPRRIVSVHIGERTSAAAYFSGSFVSSTCGSATPLPGLHDVGSLPAGAPLLLAQRLGKDSRVVSYYLRHHSGISAVADGRATYRDIVAGAMDRDVDCLRALSLLSRAVAHAVAALATDLDGIDALVFSGSGASWILREDVCRRLAVFGVAIDKRALRRQHGILDARGSRVRVVSVEADAWSAMSDAAALAMPRPERTPVPRKRPRRASPKKLK